MSARRKRRPSRQGELQFHRRGGFRQNAGRPTLGPERLGPEHRRREKFRRPAPVHVTMRMRRDVRASLRRGKLYDKARAALPPAQARPWLVTTGWKLRRGLIDTAEVPRTKLG
jgi:hypothetical protein